MAFDMKTCQSFKPSQNDLNLPKNFSTFFFRSICGCLTLTRAKKNSGQNFVTALGTTTVKVS